MDKWAIENRSLRYQLFKEQRHFLQKPLLYGDPDWKKLRMR
ncbi:hypothetical protein [Synechococcus sp. PCC 7335]|nr:hypothetical protein [Synechococcus sp. PCC 7335]